MDNVRAFCVILVVKKVRINTTAALSLVVTAQILVEVLHKVVLFNQASTSKVKRKANVGITALYFE